jgi:hypothetical protein
MIGFRLSKSSVAERRINAAAAAAQHNSATRRRLEGEIVGAPLFAM